MKRSIVTLAAITITCLFTVIANATNFLEEEAGICAYTNAGRTINLLQIEALYRTVEHKTDNYIVGSMPIGDYPETEDVHIYAHKDGWVVAYYPAGEPVSKIIDWRNYQVGEIKSTKLKLALIKVSDAVNFTLSDIKYYDFLCPQANRLLIVLDEETAKNNASDSFNIMIPEDVTVCERSWGLYGYGAYYSHGSTLKINEDTIYTLSGDQGQWVFAYGKLTPDQLKQGLFYTIGIQVGAYANTVLVRGGIALVYRQP